MNKLYYGDNLVWRADRTAFPDASVDLIYLDPPFNSNATYSQLFKTPDGRHADSQIEAFEDTWVWGLSAEAAYKRVIEGDNTDVSLLLSALRGFLHDNAMMAYLAMMAARLVELHRVLKPTGSLYLHCDPTASHYLKLLLDAVFGPEQFLNEITWKRTSAHSDGGRYGRNTDIILFYARNGGHTWNPQRVDYDETYLKRYRNRDADGRLWMDDNLTAKGLAGGGYTYAYKGVTSLWRMPLSTMERLDAEGRLHFTRTGGIRLKRYLDDSRGLVAQSLWDDIPPINSQAAERLGYPTQKPLALLERIIAASSNPGDVVLDPFCGCGTAVHAAEKLGRRWIGIDLTHLAISLVEKRLRDAFPGVEFQTEGRPKSLEDAEELARRDKHEFQKWVVTWIGARPWRGGRKGADGGIDGLLFFNGFDAKTEKATHEKAIVSVKGGQTRGVGFVAELVETIGREQAALGVLIMAAMPTREMEKRAAAAGFFDTGLHGQQIPRIQILTLAELWQGKRPQVPNVSPAMFKAAKAEAAGQPTLEL